MNEQNNWFKFAKDDWIVAKAARKEKVFNLACFHAQQGVEKMLKGYLSINGQDVPKIHSLAKLLTLCSRIDRDFKNISEMCIKLDDYYVPMRYPDTLPGMSPEGMPTADDAKEAIASLKKVIDFVMKKL